MEQIKRYAFEDEVIEVPLRWDEGTQTYVEDYKSVIENPIYSPSGRPVLLTIEDACPYTDMVDDDPVSIDCGSCRHDHQFPGSLLGDAGMNKDALAGNPKESNPEQKGGYNMKKRILAVLLCFCLLVGLLSTAAFAVETDTGKAIQLGIGGITGYAATNSYDYIYFGYWEATDTYTTSGPIKWRVLDTKTNMDNATEGDGLFLLSDILFGTGKNGGVYFQQVKHWVDSNSIYHQGSAPSNGDHSTCLLWNSWQGSDAQKWCNSFYDTYLTTQEQSAVLATTKSDGEFIANEGKSSSYRYTLAASENILNSDKVFFLSAEEANEKAYGFTEYTVEGWPYSADHARVAYYGNTNKLGSWWLRSPVSTNVASTVGSIPVNGFVFSSNPAGDKAARPAFNLNQNSVLFTSAAVDGKSSGAVGAGSLQAVSDYSGTEWKLTLLDTNRSFSANVDGQTNVSASAGGSVQITYSGAQTGDNEYVSVLLCDSSDNVLYYGNIVQNSENGTVAINIPSELAEGNYTLKVFSEQYNGTEKTDYASAFQNISLKIADLQQETTTSAVFTATGDNGGTLSNVDTSMKYSVDGGNTWNDIPGEAMEISGVTTENGIKVYKQGNGTTTSDSEVQTIDVTQAAQPTGVDKSDCTTPQQNDGQITDVDTTMEYRLSGDSDWTAVTGNPVTGLTNGTYEIRVKASGTVLASTAATVTIGAHTCVHQGGTATCTEQATCEICNEKYGSLGAHKLLLTTKVEETCTTDGKEAYYTCEVCGKYFEDEAGDTEIANLDEWGIIPTAGHKSGTEWKSDADNHWKECTVAGCGVIIDDSKAAHTASDWITDTAATETTDGTKHKECTVCGYVLETGTIPATGIGHTHSYGESWKFDGDNHWHACSCGDKTDVAAHSETDDGDCTTAVECTVCSYVTKAAETSHSFTSYTFNNDASCTTDGTETATCDHDGCTVTDTRTDSGSANGHAWEDNYTVDKAATCTEDGSRSIHCKNCDVVKDSEVIPKTGHTYGELIAKKPATYSATGMKAHYICSQCGGYFDENKNPINEADLIIPKLTGGGSSSGGGSATYYTLTFETNGGSAIAKVSGKFGRTISLSGYVPTRDGYDFSGWYSDEELTNKITEIKLAGNQTVYAGWTERKENSNIGAGNPFTDVKETDWFYDDAMFVYGKGLMAGTSGTTFSPYSNTTRAQIAVIFYRLAGSPVVEGKNTFTDVANAWYYDGVTWAQQSGIMDGYGNNLFGPNDPVTREQLASIFCRYAQYKGYDMAITGNLDSFTDKDRVSAWAQQAVKWAVGNGILGGRENHLLDPKGTATRAEIAAMLHRFIEN